jgi:hypothetical protein
MAIVRMTGLVEIDLADLYGWFEKQVKELGDDAGAISFSKSENAVLVNRPDGSEIARAAAEDFWTWVATSALPEGLRGFEVAYGVPKVDADQGGYCMAIEFAASNVDDPRSWGQPPAFLSGWIEGS